MISQEVIDFAREALGLAASVQVQATGLGKRGSDRSFFRITWLKQESAILVEYDPERQENCYHAAIARFLGEIGVPVPSVICHDPVRHFALMEDLGDTDLWSMRDMAGERQGMYRQTIAALQRLHSFPEKDFPFERVPLMEPFDGELYRWERSYFMEHFVAAVCGIQLDPGFAGALEKELSDLACRLVAGPRCLVHRDFQSQNVMVQNHRPVFIDFQGMRFGSPFYDLGSLLCDPYVEFTETERNDCLEAYCALSSWGLDPDAFSHYFWDASIQRLMQALGAYGFLGLSKGLTVFLDHIPAGLRNLETAALRAPVPHLRRLLEVCRSSWMERKTGIHGGSH